MDAKRTNTFLTRSAKRQQNLMRGEALGAISQRVTGPTASASDDCCGTSTLTHTRLLSNTCGVNKPGNALCGHMNVLVQMRTRETRSVVPDIASAQNILLCRDDLCNTCIY